ncbi:tyrosine-type recombinase/integrase [Limnohabitans sp. yimb22184]|uniref:tyrosine-type recombinase/integrase n=1 Tax=Limnohabitans sp. YIMB22184 TaxID=3374104 RepID=UPI003A8B5CAE
MLFESHTDVVESTPTVAPAKARSKAGLTDTALKALKPQAKAYKVSDGKGLYVMVLPSGTKTFRLDYRLTGADGKTNRETLTIGRYEPDTKSRSQEQLDALDYGAVVSLADARALRDRASRQVKAGESPSKAKVQKRTENAEADTFGTWVQLYFEFKADPKSGDEQLADSTLELRKSVYRRLLEKPLGKKRLDEIKPLALAELFKTIKAERGPGPAVHARELALLVYRHAIGNGMPVVNPVDSIQRSSIATFKVRERNLNRREIKTFLDALQVTPTMPTLRMALNFMLLTMVRKGEFIGATWKEIDWERSTWTIPKERMKADREHIVPLSEQALDILTTLRSCFPSSQYLHPGRYDSDIPISNATLNRVIDAAVKVINDELAPDAEQFDSFSVHDLRRTASTRLNEAMFPEALVEACLAHQKKDQVAAAYNHAKHIGPRRALMQGWADMIGCWVKGESAREVIVATKAKIDAAAHDDSEIDL